MHLDDILGPGIQTHKISQNTKKSKIPPSEQRFVWTGNPPFEFKYYPGEKLSDNYKAFKQEKGILNIKN